MAGDRAQDHLLRTIYRTSIPTQEAIWKLRPASAADWRYIDFCEGSPARALLRAHSHPRSRARIARAHLRVGDDGGAHAARLPDRPRNSLSPAARTGARKAAQVV